MYLKKKKLFTKTIYKIQKVMKIFEYFFIFKFCEYTESFKRIKSIFKNSILFQLKNSQAKYYLELVKILKF